MYWYLIHTKPRQEKIALENLERQGYPCFLPLFPKEKLIQGAIGVTDEPLFPRYLFVQLGEGNSAKSWIPVRSTKGVSRLVTFGVEPAKVPSGLIEALCAQQASMHAEPERLFREGQRVRLTESPFTGIEGIYQMADGGRRVMVLIEIMAKPLLVRVATASLRKVS